MRMREAQEEEGKGRGIVGRKEGREGERRGKVQKRVRKCLRTNEDNRGTGNRKKTKN